MKFSEWLSLKENQDTQLSGDTQVSPETMMAADAARRLGIDMTQFMQALKRITRAPVNPNTHVSKNEIDQIARMLNVAGAYSGPSKGNNKWVG